MGKFEDRLSVPHSVGDLIRAAQWDDETKGLDSFICEFRSQAEVFQFRKLPDDLEPVFRELPRGVREHYASLETNVPSCLESAEIEDCQNWNECRFLPECARGYVSRLGAGWMWE